MREWNAKDRKRSTSKERGNYGGICMRYDCVDRGLICGECHNYSKYIKRTTKGEKNGN